MIPDESDSTPAAAGVPAAGSSGDAPQGPALSARLRPWVGPLVVLLFAFAFFSPFLLRGKVFLAADTLYHFYPWRSYAPPGFAPHNTLITDPVNMGFSFSEIYNQQLKQGRLLTWSPYVLGGVPTSNGRSYPLTLLFHRLFPTHVAMSLIIFTHLILMGLFMYLYLKEIGAGSRGAVFGAVAFMFNGCAMVWLTFETLIPNAAYVPLLLLLMERYQGRRRFFYAFLGALVLGLVILLGHIQYLLYVGMIMLFYAGFLLVRAALRRAPAAELAAIAACAAVTVAGGVLVGALELLPTYEVIGYSSRVSRTFDFKGLFDTLGSVPYRWLVTLVFPDYYGSPVKGFGLFPSHPKEYLNYNELCLFMGIPTLFAFLALALRPRTAHARFFLGLTVVATAMLAGSMLFYPFFAWFPGLGKLNPTRMIFIFVFAAAAAAGLGIRNIEESDAKHRRIFAAAALGLAAAVTLLAFASSSRWAIEFFNRESLGPGGNQSTRVYEMLGSLRSVTSPIILPRLLITLAAAALCSLWAWFRQKRWAPLFPALLTLLLGWELIAFGWDYNTLVDRKNIFPTTPSIAFLQRQPGPFRVVQDARGSLYVNSLQPFGIQEIGGYMSVYPDRVNKIMSAIEYGPRALQGAAFDRWVMFGNVLHPLFDMFNVKYVLTAPGNRLQENPRYKLVYTGDLTIYENLQALPRAYAVHRPVLLEDTAEIVRRLNSSLFDPRTEVILEEPPPAGFGGGQGAGASPVSVDRYEFDEVALTAEMAADGWVVLADTYYPGWEAEVDGTATRILRANGTLRAVPVPAGKHRVTFRYRPPAVYRGRLLSLLGLLLAVGGMVVAARAGRKARPS